MAIQYVNVSIRRDELTTIKECVPEWEVPLLQVVHGEGVSIITTEGDPVANRESPNVGEEFERLAARYKRSRNEDGSPGEVVVAAVYGNFKNSPQLAAAIKAATVKAKKDLL